MYTRLLVNAFLAVAVVVVPAVSGQVTPEELELLLVGLAQKPREIDTPQLERRVPLSTNDSTVAPLIDLQVFAPPVIPQDGTSCEVVLLEHIFGE